MPLPLSKTLDLADFDQLTKELAVVDANFTLAREQHPMRRWEYAMALRAIATWRQQTGKGLRLLDVGGAGSPFFYMVPDGIVTKVIDPDADPETNPWEERRTLAEKACDGTRLRSIVTCLSVLEHVDDLDQFCYHLSCLVAPGGLLFLTMDCAPQQPDTYHFHWMRKRIFSVSDWAQLHFRFRDFDLFGPEDDWAYHGPQVYDYTFASLCLVKRA